MAIQISGTTVISDSKAITNVVSYSGDGVATQAEAEAGTNNDQLMTPLRVAQAISAAGGSVIKSIQTVELLVTGSSSNTASATINSVNPAKTMLVASGVNANDNSCQARLHFFKMSLDNATTVSVIRGAVLNVPVEAKLQIVEFN